MSDEVCVMLYHISFILPKLWSGFYSGNIFGGIPPNFGNSPSISEVGQNSYSGTSLAGNCEQKV